jgi:hypothetical protein
MTHTLRYISILALCITSAWISHRFDVESSLALLAALSAYVASDLLLHKKNKAELTQEPDRNLFNELSQLLPANGIIRYLMDQDIAAGFEPHVTRPLQDFVGNWNDPQHTFHDRKLQKQLDRLTAATATFLSEFAVKTYPDHRNYQKVQDEWLENGREQEYWVTVKNLNKYADEVASAYNKLSALAKKRLLI